MGQGRGGQPHRRAVRAHHLDGQSHSDGYGSSHCWRTGGLATAGLTWPHSGVAGVQSHDSEAATHRVCRVRPAGREIREQMFTEVKGLLHDLDAAMLPISVFFPYLPIPAHKARDK